MFNWDSGRLYARYAAMFKPIHLVAASPRLPGMECPGDRLQRNTHPVARSRGRPLSRSQTPAAGAPQSAFGLWPETNYRNPSHALSILKQAIERRNVNKLYVQNYEYLIQLAWPCSTRLRRRQKDEEE